MASRPPQKDTGALTVFAYGACINIASWFIISGLGSSRSTLTAPGRDFIGVLSIISFVVSLIVSLCTIGEASTRTGQAHNLASVLVFGLTAALSLVGDGWVNLYHRLSYAFAGLYLGFALESIMGLVNAGLKMLEKAG